MPSILNELEPPGPIGSTSGTPLTELIIWHIDPTVASGMEQIGTFLNKRSSLSKREVEIGILVIAQHWQGDYVRQAHIREGKAAGLSEETIDAILAGADPKLTDAHERAVHRFAAALVGGGKRTLPISRRSWAATASPRCSCCWAITRRWRWR